MATSLTAARQPLTRFPSMAYRLVNDRTTSRLNRLNAPTAMTAAAASSRPFSASAPYKSAPNAGSFSYSVASSYIGKDRRYDPSTHVFHFNPYHRFSPTNGTRKRPDSGHDAFFVSRIGDTGATAMGVADGVGGWVESGVDPADFSHGLCENMAALSYEHDPSSTDGSKARIISDSQPPTARSVLQAGYQAVCEDRSIRAGGSTACVAVASDEGQVEVANLGDSGFLHIRLGAVHAYTDPQTHAFNTPYQLSVVPPQVAARMAAFGGAQLSDFPRDADVTTHKVRHGDVLVFASDGVWDNLFNQDILRVTSRVMSSAGAWKTGEEGDVEDASSAGGIKVIDGLQSLTESKSTSGSTLQSVLATEITTAAKAASVNSKRDGPFAKEVQKWYPHENWRGGKVDDIVVVVAVVTDNAKSGQDQPKAKL